ncbi:MAG: hypothetical protein F4103_05815 [Boseongicola sp. SB0673_bin_14]|nr:hypothetical protein [Boseongicola sp. SB0673_bin_14]
MDDLMRNGMPQVLRFDGRMIDPNGSLGDFITPLICTRASNCFAAVSAPDQVRPLLPWRERHDDLPDGGLVLGNSAIGAEPELPVTRQRVVQYLDHIPQGTHVLVACVMCRPDDGRHITEPSQSTAILGSFGFQILGEPPMRRAIDDLIVPDRSVAMTGRGWRNAQIGRMGTDRQDGFEDAAADMHHLVNSEMRRPIVDKGDCLRHWDNFGIGDKRAFVACPTAGTERQHDDRCERRDAGLVH